MSLFALCVIKGITIENHQHILKDMYKFIMDEKFCNHERWLQRYDLISNVIISILFGMVVLWQYGCNDDVVFDEALQMMK